MGREWSKEQRERQSEKMKEITNRPEQRRIRSERMKEYRKEHPMPSVKGLKWTEEQKKRKSESTKRVMNRPEVRALNSKIQKKIWNTPAGKKAQSDRQRKYWASCSEEKRKARACHMQSFIDRPSKGQLQLFEKIRLYYPSVKLEFFVKGRFLDIALPEYRIDIEYDGVYWHRNSEVDCQRDEFLRGLGWIILRIREGELFDMNKLHELIAKSDIKDVAM